MVWTAPITWVDELSDASDFNTQIRDNLLALKHPPTSHYESNEGSDYSNTSGDWADIDTDTNFAFTSYGGAILLGMICTTKPISEFAVDFTIFDVEIDGTRIKNSAGGIASAAQRKRVSFLYLIEGIAAGVHNIKFQFRAAQSSDGLSVDAHVYAGAGTTNYDVHPRFWVREIS